MDFAAVAELCAPGVPADMLKRIASVESSFNPYAIGVVGGRLARQPKTLSEALVTAQMLDTQGYDYSLGVVQVNQKNFARYGLTAEAAFDPCANLRVGSLIFQDCYKRAGLGARRLGDALSCYYSGNFKTGYRLGYVAKVQAADGNTDSASIQPIPILSDRRSRKSQGVGKASARRAPEPLFVNATAPGPKAPIPGTNVITTAAGKETALLF